MYGNSENRGKIQICSRRLKKSPEKVIVKVKIGKVIHEFENLKQGENTSLSQRGWTPLVRPTRSFHVFGPSLWNRLSPSVRYTLLYGSFLIPRILPFLSVSLHWKDSC